MAKKTNLLRPNEEIEVVMKKNMTYQEYLDMFQQAKKKGWEVQGYQIGFFSEGIKIK